MESIRASGRLLNTSTSANGKGERVTCQMSKLSTSCSIQQGFRQAPHAPDGAEVSIVEYKTAARLCGCTAAAFE